MPPFWDDRLHILFRKAADNVSKAVPTLKIAVVDEVSDSELL
jgi:hypothetical protein